MPFPRDYRFLAIKFYLSQLTQQPLLKFLTVFLNIPPGLTVLPGKGIDHFLSLCLMRGSFRQEVLASQAVFMFLFSDLKIIPFALPQLPHPALGAFPCLRLHTDAVSKPWVSQGCCRSACWMSRPPAPHKIKGPIKGCLRLVSRRHGCAVLPHASTAHQLLPLGLPAPRRGCDRGARCFHL